MGATLSDLALACHFSYCQQSKAKPNLMIQMFANTLFEGHYLGLTDVGQVLMNTACSSHFTLFTHKIHYLNEKLGHHL